jgi:hypothetical protein
MRGRNDDALFTLNPSSSAALVSVPFNCQQALII